MSEGTSVAGAKWERGVLGMTPFTKKLVYVYDALCPWCYAFTAVVQSLRKYYGSHFEYEVLSGGMYRGDRVKTVGGVEEAQRLRDAYERIEGMTGAVFGERFFDHVAEGERRLDSELAAVALAAFRMVTVPGAGDDGIRRSELDFAHTVLRFVFEGGGDPTEPDFYKSVAHEIGLDGRALLEAMESADAKDAAIYDFALVRQLGADGFPRLYLQTAEDYLHLVAKGYAPFEQVHSVIEKIESDSSAGGSDHV